MTKKLILVVSPPACGKTYVSKKLAETLTHVVYLDKDTLIPLSKKLKEELNASLYFIWVNASEETCHRRMIDRNSSRDTWKLENWDEYIKGVDFSIPTPLSSKESGAKLLVFDNDHDETFADELTKTAKILETE